MRGWRQMNKEIKISHPAPGVEMEEIVEEPLPLTRAKRAVPVAARPRHSARDMPPADVRTLITPLTQQDQSYGYGNGEIIVRLHA
jgi:hypothetical protein